MALFLIFLLCLVAANAFVFTSTRAGRRMQPSMMFGKKKETKVVIKVDGKTFESEEKTVNLRKELMNKKVDVYPLRAKLTGNCGGAGICGTCAVRVLEGMENINPPSKNEQNTLAGKADDIRLSCCARVSGPISIKTKP
ncbi:hypothetical protein B484DRAFT_448182 [Ochromonadaceae sp. CCMP2298]|nr:hypothetical protein B484DRAFT_448182 [Ochromonadaceae sp. CCMP2298]